MQTENIIYLRQLPHNIVDDALLQIISPVQSGGSCANIAVIGKVATSTHPVENFGLCSYKSLISTPNQYAHHCAITVREKHWASRLLAQNPGVQIKHGNRSMTPGLKAKK